MYIIIKGIPFESVEQAFAVCKGETYVDNYGFADADIEDMRPMAEVDVDYDDNADAHKALRTLRKAFPTAEIEFI